MNLTLWGFDLILLIAALTKFAKDAFSWDDKMTSYFTAGLTFLGVVGVSFVPELVIAYPLIGQYGPVFLTAFSAALGVLGFMPSVSRGARMVSQRLSH